MVRDSPLVVLAGQRPVHQLADGGRVTDVVDDHDQRQLSAALPVDLVRHIRQVQLQLLPVRRERNEWVLQPGQKIKETSKAEPDSLPFVTDDAC